MGFWQTVGATVLGGIILWGFTKLVESEHRNNILSRIGKIILHISFIIYFSLIVLAFSIYLNQSMNDPDNLAYFIYALFYLVFGVGVAYIVILERTSHDSLRHYISMDPDEVVKGKINHYVAIDPEDKIQSQIKHYLIIDPDKTLQTKIAQQIQIDPDEALDSKVRYILAKEKIETLIESNRINSNIEDKSNADKTD